MAMDVRIIAALMVTAWLWLLIYGAWQFYVQGQDTINALRALGPTVIVIVIAALDIIISLLAGRI